MTRSKQTLPNPHSLNKRNIGYVLVYRSIRDNFLYAEERSFSRYEAYLDLLFDANHEPAKIMMNGRLIVVERGSFITSKLKLSVRWDWSRGKLERFLKLLISEGMIDVKTDNEKTYISIINYDSYQAPYNQDSTTDDTTHEQRTNNAQATNKEQQKNNERTTKERREIPKLNFPEILNTPLHREAWAEWLTYRQEIKKSYKTLKAQQAELNSWISKPEKFIPAIRNSIRREYQGIFEPKDDTHPQKPVSENQAIFEKVMTSASQGEGPLRVMLGSMSLKVNEAVKSLGAARFRLCSTYERKALYESFCAALERPPERSAGTVSVVATNLLTIAMGTK